jgi:hypothetical protein
VDERMAQDFHNGKKFMSFSFKPKDQQIAKPVAKPMPASPEIDDDMPF